jgi:membrane protease YdiL (CAAX protease family)
MTSTNTNRTHPNASPDIGEGGSLARRHPVAAFAVLVFGLGWSVFSIPVITGLPNEPFLLFANFFVLLASALLVTRLAGGPGAIRKLLSRLLIWRFGVVRWAVILFGVPVLTLAIAAVSGTLGPPADGWAITGGWYLFNTLIFGALILNLWEETAWGGFVQSRLMARHGLLMGSLLTAPLFAGIHIPLLFTGDWTWSDVGVGAGWVFALAPFYRYLLGMLLLDTGGSLLAIGVQHAAWNAAGSIDGVHGEWQVLVGVAVLTLLVAGGRRLQRPEDSPTGLAAEKAAAATWTATRPTDSTASAG